MPLDNPMVLLLGAVALVSLLGVLWLVFTASGDPVEERLSDVKGEQVRLRSGGVIQDPASVIKARKSWAHKEDRRRKFGERLVQAGLYKRNSTFFFYALQVSFGAAPIVIGFALATMGFVPLRTALLLGAITGIGGVILPGFWLDAQKKSRQTAIRRALPDALDLLVICVEAGLSLPASLVRITKELRTAHPMLAMELIIVHREIQLGQSTGDALRRFADRFDMEELRGLASVIRQAEKFGASIVNAIRVHAETLRHKRMEAAKERAQKAAVKLLFPTVLCIFPAIFVVILGPAVFRIYAVFSQIGSSGVGVGQ